MSKCHKRHHVADTGTIKIAILILLLLILGNNQINSLVYSLGMREGIISFYNYQQLIMITTTSVFVQENEPITQTRIFQRRTLQCRSWFTVTTKCLQWPSQLWFQFVHINLRITLTDSRHICASEVFAKTCHMQGQSKVPGDFDHPLRPIPSCVRQTSICEFKLQSTADVHYAVVRVHSWLVSCPGLTKT